MQRENIAAVHDEMTRERMPKNMSALTLGQLDPGPGHSPAKRADALGKNTIIRILKPGKTQQIGIKMRIQRNRARPFRFSELIRYPLMMQLLKPQLLSLAPTGAGTQAQLRDIPGRFVVAARFDRFQKNRKRKSLSLFLNHL